MQYVTASLLPLRLHPTLIGPATPDGWSRLEGDARRRTLAKGDLFADDDDDDDDTTSERARSQLRTLSSQHLRGRVWLHLATSVCL